MLGFLGKLFSEHFGEVGFLLLLFIPFIKQCQRSRGHFTGLYRSVYPSICRSVCRAVCQIIHGSVGLPVRLLVCSPVWFTGRLSLRCVGLAVARSNGCFAHRFACRQAKRFFLAVCRSQWQGGNRSAVILYSESGLHDLSRAIAVRGFRAQLAMSASNCVGEHSLAPAMIDTMVVKMLVACFFHFGIHAPWQQVTQPSSFGATRDRMNCGVATARSTAQECSLILLRYKKDLI